MKHQRTIILYIAMSLDGYIADPDGAVDWLDEAEGEGDNGYSAFYETVDTIIMGRATYNQVLTFGCAWPYAGKRCYVFTNREYAPDSNVEFINGNIVEFITKIKSQPGKHIWLVGGANMVHNFMQKNLIDEFAIAIIPTLLGKGIPLFHCERQKLKLKLVENRQYKDIVLVHYRKS